MSARWGDGTRKSAVTHIAFSSTEDGGLQTDPLLAGAQRVQEPLPPSTAVASINVAIGVVPRRRMPLLSLCQAQSHNL